MLIRADRHVKLIALIDSTLEFDLLSEGEINLHPVVREITTTLDDVWIVGDSHLTTMIFPHDILLVLERNRVKIVENDGDVGAVPRGEELTTAMIVHVDNLPVVIHEVVIENHSKTGSVKDNFSLYLKH